MDLEVLHTADGSATLRNKQLNATYHSMHGAVQESRHIFIEAGLKQSIRQFGKQLSILEIGFGTGLNTLLSLEGAQKQDLQINYSAIEKYPIPLSIASGLNYGTEADKNFMSMHKAAWNESAVINQNFTLCKYLCDVNDFHFPKIGRFHLVYYDAFAPETCPDMWNEFLFERLYTAMLPGAILVSFCAKGIIKRALKHSGFKVEALPGPPGKREMTRATR